MSLFERRFSSFLRRVLLKCGAVGVLVFTCTAIQAQSYNIFFRETNVTLESGSNFDITVALQNTPDAVTGFSFGVMHTANFVTLTGVSCSSELDALGVSCAAGSTEGFVHVDLSPTAPGGRAGFTMAALLSVGAELITIPPGNDTALVQASYTLDASSGNDEIRVSDQLGSPAVDVVIDLDGVSQEPTAPNQNTVVDVNVQITGGDSHPFIRGDVNASGRLEISDAINHLSFQFSGGLPAGEETRANCLVIYNTDGSSASGIFGVEDPADINIADAIRILAFLFQSGSPPEVPFPGCGKERVDVPTSPEMTCQAYARCTDG